MLYKSLTIALAVMGVCAAQANFATFDNVTTGTDLTAYVEDGMNITVANSAFTGFDPTAGHGGFTGGFHYPNGGANGATSISMVNGSRMGLISFNLGSGWGTQDVFYHYWAYRGSVEVANVSGALFAGNVFSITDGQGFDLFRISASPDAGSAAALTPGDFQAVALDNVRTAPVPEPATMTALGLGVVALIRRRRSAK